MFKVERRGTGMYGYSAEVQSGHATILSHEFSMGEEPDGISALTVLTVPCLGLIYVVGSYLLLCLTHEVTTGNPPQS